MIVACCLFKYFPFSGLSLDMEKVAIELLKRNHNIRIFTMEWQGEQIPGIEVVTIDCNAITNHGRVRQYIKALKENLEAYKPDVTIGFNKMPFLDYYYVADVCYENAVAQKKGMLKKLYKLTTRYKTFSECESAVFGKDSKTKLLFLDVQQIPFFKEYYSLTEKKSYVLPPGVSTEFSKRMSSDEIAFFRESIGVKRGEFLIIQVGSDFRRKGVDRSLRAIASLPTELRRKVKFHVLGKGNNADFINLTKSLKIERQVLFIGGSKMTPEYMKSADIFLHPAYVENTGTVILEALTSRTPQIVTEVCGFSHYVRESGAGLVVDEPYQQTNFNKILYSLLINHTKLRSMRSCAEVYCSKKDLHGMAKAFVNIIEGNDKEYNYEF